MRYNNIEINNIIMSQKNEKKKKIEIKSTFINNCVD